MNIEPRITIPVILALFVTAACADPAPLKSEAIERAKPSQTMLASTAPAVVAEPVDEKKQEPPAVQIAEVVADAEPALEELPRFEPELESLDGLTIQRFVTTSEVEHREPVAASSVFGHHDERVYAFVEVSNESEDDKTLLVHFIGPDGHVSGGIELRIPAAVPRWRTWAYTRHATKPGLWRVEIRSKDGTLVGALPFEVDTGC